MASAPTGDEDMPVALIAALKALESMPFDCPPALQKEVQSILQELPASLRKQLLEGQKLDPKLLEPMDVKVQMDLLKRCLALHTKAVEERHGEPRDTRNGKGYSYYASYYDYYSNGKYEYDYYGDYSYYGDGGSGGSRGSKSRRSRSGVGGGGGGGGGGGAAGAGAKLTSTNAPPMPDEWPPVLCRVLVETIKALNGSGQAAKAEEDVVALMDLLPCAAAARPRCADAHRGRDGLTHA